MLIEDELTDGVFAVGIVSNQAIDIYKDKTDLVLLEADRSTLSKEKDQLDFDLKLASIDKKRKVVCGPILIPDIVIPRKEYEIIFSKETILKISENFMINNNKDNITIQHETPVNKIKMIESWIVNDPEKDKSTTLGFNLPNGTWMGSYKVLDDELWNNALETGVLKGFSIEGRFSERKVEMKVEYNEELELKQLYYLATYTEKDLDNQYIWKMSNKKENCPSCLSFNGKIKTLKEWISTAIPGVSENISIAGQITSYPHSPYGTFCEGNCSCRLVKIKK